MAKPEFKQHVPIFVGSTFVDLEQYRRAVRDALHRLETIVRGMEYFGSKPGSPMDECLGVVRSCKVYIGIFGMRYGTIPEGYDRSMTHLEYDEAQRRELPSLVYLIDENNQPVLPKYVETGPAAQTLRSLKDDLCKKHVVSFFTTEEDLAGKILHDLPPVLEQIGARLDGTIESSGAGDALDVLGKFSRLPKRYHGREITIQFVCDDFSAADADAAESLSLDLGDTVSDYLTLSDDSFWRVYAEGKIAEQLINVPKGGIVEARAVTAFGTGKEIEWGDYGPHAKPVVYTGIIIREILSVAESSDSKTNS